MKRVLSFSVFLFFFLSLSAQSPPTVRVAVFIAPTCPICQQYTPTLSQLQADFPSVDWQAYVPGPVSRRAIRQFRQHYDFALPVSRDKSGQQVAANGVQITPEVVVWKGEEMVYRGRIDNGWVELGKRRGVVTEHDLRVVLEELGNGKTPAFRETEAVGCMIE